MNVGLHAVFKVMTLLWKCGLEYQLAESQLVYLMTATDYRSKESERVQA